MNTNPTPRNASEALQQANRFDRARQIIEQGYTFENMGEGYGIAVCKPGTTAAAYWIKGPFCEEGCSCPDFAKTSRPCKHMLAWEGIKAAEAEEAAMWEAQCAQYDAENGPEMPDYDPQRILMLSELRRAERGLLAVDPFTTAATGWRERVKQCEAALKVYDEVAMKQKIDFYKQAATA